MPLVHLGYAVGSGEPVEIPLRHMVVSGQSQEAGKTTTLHALIARSGLRALAFITKRGERSFTDARRIPPYFRERADWQFVASVLEATMRERMKFERAWIMRASKGAQTLAQVHENVKRLGAAAKGLSADMYNTLDEYLQIVVPRITCITFAPHVELGPGVNVVDLSDPSLFPPELQALVMRSMMEWIHERETDVVTVIPEAWEFIPEGRRSPVKLTAEQLIRKGAGLRNYVWIDSQDLAGVDKLMLRACPVWLLGVQREWNEIERTLKNIPVGTNRPKPADIAGLKKGEFFACFGDTVIKTYVQPSWMDAGWAQAHACGESIPEHAMRPAAPAPEETSMSANVEKKLDTLIELMTKAFTTRIEPPPSAESLRPPPIELSGPPFDEEALYQRFKARLVKEAPAVLKVIGRIPEIEVTDVREVLELDGKTLRGRLALLITKGFFDEPKTGNAAYNELQRLGVATSKPNVYRECDKLAEAGFLTKEVEGYKAVPDRKIVRKGA